MPYVKIRFGPYLAFGIIRHRIQKINGIFAQLDSLGYELEVIEINEYNRLTIEMYDREVFRCDIRQLSFNVPFEDDSVCRRAVKAVEGAKNIRCRVNSISNHDLINVPVSLDMLWVQGDGKTCKYSSDNVRLSSEPQINNKQETKISKVKIVDSKKENIYFSDE